MTDTTPDTDAALEAALEKATAGEGYQPDGEGGHIWNNDAEPGEGYVPDRLIFMGPNKPSWVTDRTFNEWLTENAHNLAATALAINWLRASGLARARRADELERENVRLREALQACEAFLFPRKGTAFRGSIDDAERLTRAALEGPKP